MDLKKTKLFIRLTESDENKNAKKTEEFVRNEKIRFDDMKFDLESDLAFLIREKSKKEEQLARENTSSFNAASLADFLTKSKSADLKREALKTEIGKIDSKITEINYRLDLLGEAEKNLF